MGLNDRRDRRRRACLADGLRDEEEPPRDRLASCRGLGKTPRIEDDVRRRRRLGGDHCCAEG